MTGQHLLFYDGECGLCDHTVRLVLQMDKEGKFLFSPLQGQAAKRLLPDELLLENGSDTLVVVEDWQGNPKIHTEGSGALRLAWLLGGVWRLIGWLYFFHFGLANPLYRLVARNRHRLFGKETCINPNLYQDRFLD